MPPTISNLRNLPKEDKHQSGEQIKEGPQSLRDSDPLARPTQRARRDRPQRARQEARLRPEKGQWMMRSSREVAAAATMRMMLTSAGAPCKALRGKWREGMKAVGLAPAPGDGGASGDVSVIAQPGAACRIWKRLHRHPFAGKTATFLNLNGNR